MYEKLISEQQHVCWDRMVCNRLIVPKHRFILWTTSRLFQYGVSQNALCLICWNLEETQSLINWIFKEFEDMAWCQFWLKRYAVAVQECAERAHNKIPKISDFATLAALIYSSWQSRNFIYWQHCLTSIATVVKQCKCIVTARVLVLPKKITRKDQMWLNTL